MSNVPTNLIPSTITQLPEYDGSSTLGYFPYSLGGRTYKVQFSNLAAVGAVPSTRTIATGNGLQGGGDLSQNRTISIISHGVGYAQLDFTGVTAGTYGSADTIPAITVDDTGRVTAVVDTPVVLSNYVPSSRTVTAGAGLTGGGQLNGNITISLNPSNATPQPLGAASAGTGTQAARDDHVHPAVDLTDTSETQGVLPLGRGGTGVDLSPVLGAVIYADNDSLNQTTAGNVGQVLTSAGGLGAPYWQTISGIGTVTSIDVSGGSTGLTTSGGPVTTVGTITIGGTLNPTSGGTGITSFAVGDLLFANTTTSLDKLTVGSNGYLLASNGTAPQYTNPTSVTVGTATNLAGGAGGSIPYQSIAGATTFLASGTGVLTASGGNPSYTMTPSLTQVTVAGDPTTNLQVATKQYVDTLVSSGITYHTPVKYEVPDTTGNLNATYNNGTAGVGATLTNAGTLGAFTPDGTVAQVGDRILIYNQTNAYENGVYTVTTVGSGSVAWVLTRSTDTDSYALKDPNGLGEGDAFFITSGATGAGETYVCNTSGTITFGTTPITFVQVSATQVYSAGTGLTLTGTTFSLTAPVATSLGGTGLTSFTSGGAVYATSTSALTTGTLPVTAGGTGATTLTANYVVKGNGTSAVSASIIYDNGTSVSIGSTSSGSSKFYVYDANASISTNEVAAGGTGVASSRWKYSTNHYGIYVGSVNAMVFYDYGASAERMRIDSSGNVLVGYTAAYDKLQVAGSISSQGGGYFGFYRNGPSNNITTLDGVTVSQFGVSSGVATGRSDASTWLSGFDSLRLVTAGTERMRIDSSGNVGIGTTSPGNKLDIVSAGSSQIRVKDGVGATAYYDFGRDGSDGFFGFSGAQTTFSGYKWSVNAGTEVMRITNGGNVGIGTSSPGAKFEVNGSGVMRLATSTNTTGFDFGFLGGPTDPNGYVFNRNNGAVVLGTNNTERFRIAANGAWGLGGTNYGTSGQVLTSNGSGSAPTWQTPAMTQAKATALSMILGF